MASVALHKGEFMSSESNNPPIAYGNILSERLLFVSSDTSAESCRTFAAFADALPGRIEQTNPCASTLAGIEKCLLILLYIGPCVDGWKSAISLIAAKPLRVPVIAVADLQTLSRLDPDLENKIDDIIPLPASPDELKQRLTSILERRNPSATDILKQEIFMRMELEGLIGRSDQFLSAVQQIHRAGSSDVNVLICGETGTGKELFARSIHYLGCRADQPFIPVNCGAIPESLFENEFFGHTRGAYTGASESRQGLIHEAEGGTLFLDEINALSVFTQVKLLRFLEDRTYRALGSTKYSQSNVRVISAANTDLLVAAESSGFRQDLLYRINTLTFNLPPLRDRAGDVPILAEYFLQKFAKLNSRSPMCFSPDAMKKLTSYPWPGNVRELQHMIEKVVLVSRSSLIRAKDIPLDLMTPAETPPFLEAKQQALRKFERDYVLKLLNENNWNISKSARSAHKDRRWLQRLLRKHGLSAVSAG